MKFYSTKEKNYTVDLRTAVLESLPPDNGLYMPLQLPRLLPKFIENLDKYSFQEIAFRVCRPFLSEDLSDNEIRNLVERAINFPAPLIALSENLYSLELWHGPSLAFKDFGARFMAELMSLLIKNEDRKLHILVATSGDTGGAVASGFYDVPNIEVVILYPSGKVSPLQEKQLTTLGKNITALEISGTFDDCQTLVKRAFLDTDLNHQLQLSSANSINISRLIPQCFYYFEAFKQIPKSLRKQPIVFCVPSGNFGNLTAGLITKRMGLPYHKMLAATNINDVVPRYLETGVYDPKSAFATISNAMDVGSPSNFQRLLDLYDSNVSDISNDVTGYRFTDKATRKAILEIKEKYNYTADPHGAVGFLACSEYLEENPNSLLINLETAHPSKFLDVMREVGIHVEIPERLAVLQDRKKSAVPLDSRFESFKSFLLSSRI